MRRSTLIISLAILSLHFQSLGQGRVIDGFVFDKQKEEPLPFANILLKNQRIGTTSDENGYFSIGTISNTDTLIISYIGYRMQQFDLSTLETKQLNVQLSPTSTSLREVEVTGKRSIVVEAYEDMAISKFTVEPRAVMLLPSLTGEPDFIKTLLLLPGAAKGVEGTTDIFVRGGDADQNLVLFNGATVYNTGHLFGFLSVFNPYATSSATMLTGGFPAQYGGRLSSIIDIESRKPSFNQLTLEGSIGTLASNLALEVPIVKDKLSIMVAGRRTYADQVIRIFNESLPYYFYDVNAQVDYHISDKLNLRYHFYNGEDVLDFVDVEDDGDTGGSNFVIENNTHTLSLDARPSENLSIYTNLYYTQFRYDIFSFFQDNRLSVVSDIFDLGLQHRYDIKISPNQQITTGVEVIRHVVDPNLIDSSGEISELIPPDEGRNRELYESALFGSWLYNRKKFTAELGMRVSSAIGQGSNYINPEPRINLKWEMNNNRVFKASYSRMYQYLHRVSSTSFALPTDIWYPITDEIKPQYADQVSFGVQQLFLSSETLLSLEGYYKEMNNQIAFREATNLALNNDFEEALIQGRGNSYGLEFLLRKEAGKVKGWLAYTLSWSNRQFDQLNLGKPFRARYDRRHYVSFVGNYSPHPRWTFSAIWEFISGARFTPLIGYSAVPNSALTGIDLIPIYPERNSVGLNDSHRLDLSVTLHSKHKKDRKWRGEWQFSIYNVYNRATPVAINLTFDDETGAYGYEQPGLFGALPSLTYRFTFQP